MLKFISIFFENKILLHFYSIFYKRKKMLQLQLKKSPK